MPLTTVLGEPQTTIRWPVIIRRYSPKSRRTLRRLLLAAEWAGVHATATHDCGVVFRLHLLTLTGTRENLLHFRRVMLRVAPAVKQRGSR
ncbi:hypothetical protein [Streptosporangium sp. NPDC051022]|uniref:hypothetical protein n=1 Tax=Streptosporangium sp. NPDC051022 TaxID=3155752 RepID=UPI00342F3259